MRHADVGAQRARDLLDGQAVIRGRGAGAERTAVLARQSRIPASALALKMPDERQSERRRSIRITCALGIDVRPVGEPYAMRCETTDINMTGCYVRTLFPLAVNTPVELTITINGTATKTTGVVKTSDPGVGIGIEFTAISAEISRFYRSYLDAIGHGHDGNVTIIR